MLAVTCDKCRRRFSLADEELQGYLQQAEGKKHTLVLCPHCGKGNKVARERLARSQSGPVGAASPGGGLVPEPAADASSAGGAPGDGASTDEPSPAA